MIKVCKRNAQVARDNPEDLGALVIECSRKVCSRLLRFTHGVLCGHCVFGWSLVLWVGCIDEWSVGLAVLREVL